MKHMMLFMNGVSIMEIKDDRFFIETPSGECLMEVNKKEFIEELKKLSYTCLTSWNKDLRKQYLSMVDYVKEMK